MGGTTFTDYEPGVDVDDAFKRAHAQAGYESGHGGYSGTIAEKGSFTIITNTPLLEQEANLLADQLIEADDARIRDKWGPAGAIPVIKETREIEVSDFTYTPTPDHREGIDPNLLEAVEPKVKLKRGEKIAEVRITSYQTPQTNRYSGYSTTISRTRTRCYALVTVAKPPSTRKAKVVIEIPPGLEYNVRRKAIQTQVDSMRLKAGESIVGWNDTRDTPSQAKVSITAPKGATETRYIVKGLQGHATWETGFASQAEARAWATEIVKDEAKWTGGFVSDVVQVEIEGVTRRVDGQPLVLLRREVGKRLVDVTITIKLAKASTQTSPDGWLFFGWASC